ncbi:hypothetical protein JCM8547_004728 [Rhodosporidiobolus lusitaniae]
MALQSAQSEQQLLYSLRSPTTPLSDKLALASSSLDSSTSSALPPLVRDWAIAVLLKASRSTSPDPTAKDRHLWALVARTTDATRSSSTASSTLPIFVAFVQQYSTDRDVELLRSAVVVWRSLAGGAVRKATADAALDGYEKLVGASKAVLGGESAAEGEEKQLWEELAVVWLKALKPVMLEGGKSGKKVLSHTLTLLPKLLPLLSLLPSTSPMRPLLLQTIQFALFNLDNLRRGLARESYAAGSTQSAVLTANAELLSALSPLLPSIAPAIYAALPSFTSSYLSALANNSFALFPLPAKANYPTPSAQKSALEVLGLTKRRELAGRWVKGVVELVGWAKEKNGEEMEVDSAAVQEGNEREKAEAIVGVLAEIEKDDLYRAGQAGEGWEDVLPSVVRGAVSRLQSSESAAAEARKALVGVMSVVARLSYESVEPALPAVLEVLASIPSPSPASSTSTSSRIDTFLSELITHHSRSISIPTLLSLLSHALSTSASSSSFAAANNILASPLFFSKLGHAISGITGGSNTVRATYENQLAPVKEALQPLTASVKEDEGEAAPSPAKKRRLSPSPLSSSSSTPAATARLRILTLFLSHLPSSALPSLLEPLREAFFSPSSLVEAHLQAFLSKAAASSTGVEEGGANETPNKKEKKQKKRKAGILPPSSSSAGAVDPAVRLGAQLLEGRYAALDRLSAEGLLEPAEGEGEWWVLGKESREGLRRAIEKGEGEAAVVAARTLLQHLELAQSTASLDEEEAQSVIKAILDRIVSTGKDHARWSGFVRDVKVEEVAVAMWEIVSRRWIGVVDLLASAAQLSQIVETVLKPFSHPPTGFDELSTTGSTARLLRRADFWELPRIQAVLQPALLTLTTLPSLPSLSSLLSSPSSSSLSSIAPETLLTTASLLPTLAATVPLEYLNKLTREGLVERALVLDLCVSEGKTHVGEGEKEKAQRELRSVVKLFNMGSSNLSTVLPRLFSTTLPGAKAATMELYQAVVTGAIEHCKTSGSPSSLLALVKEFGEKPLSDLSKRSKKGNWGVETGEEAFLVLGEGVAEAWTDVASAPPALLESLQTPTKNAFKALDKVLPLATYALQQNPETFFALGDLLEGVRKAWGVRQWMEGKKEGSEGGAELYDALASAALSAALSLRLSFSSQISAPAAVLSLLRLLAFRIERLPRAEGSGTGTEQFETFVACCLAFDGALPARARPALDPTLIHLLSSVSLPEYAAGLNGLSAVVGSLVAVGGEEGLGELEGALRVAGVVLRDGPEGSSRIATSALSDLLRHLSLLVENVEAGQGERSVEAYTVAAKFLEGVCGERPMLLSRLNISSTFTLISRLLQPSSSSAASSSSPPSPAAVDTLFCTLVTTVTHLVRHRKEHLVPLFPSLVSVLSSFIAILRCAGYGTTGSTSLDQPGETGVEVGGVALGQRAEREAKTLFPAWVWEGGAQGIGRAEARAVGRLLGALTAKTASHGVKRKKDGNDDASSGTISLVAPLSKHAPFLLLTYLRACVHATCPIPSALRGELQGGWVEVMDSVGKWEKEAIMKGFLGEEEEAERGVLRGMFKTWEGVRYRG